MYLITPLTKICKEWIKKNVSLESWQWLGNSFAVDYHYADDLIEGMMDDGGLVVDVDFTVCHC